MSTNKYKWLILGLASIVVSGCHVSSKPNLNLGIADAFRKSRNCLAKKKLGYRAPATGTNFGYAPPVNNAVATSIPYQDFSVAPSEVTVMPDQSSSIVASDCNCNNGAYVPPVTEFYMPVPAKVVVDSPTETVGSTVLPPATLPFEASEDNLELENPLPAPIEVPETPSIDLDPTEEQGIIETLDSALIAPGELDEELKITPKKDEASILDTAVKPLEAKTPTSAGESVVDQRTKMLTLTARPVQSHKAANTNTRLTKVDMQQVTHKRHFRQQNALRPLHQKFRSEALEHTAEAPGPLKFKPLPVLKKETPPGKTSGINTGAPALNTGPVSEILEQSSTKMQRLPSTDQETESEVEKESVIKIARLPILKAESTSSAAIGSLRNFTNVRDLDPGFDKDYYSRKNAEAAAAKAAEIIAERLSDASDDLSIER